ncbi:hypothetical protein [Streptomyces virginiae]|uniref:hypothetical protein n=1 Tax=Streptomyces virginiae TaxID=1961 RepID=UPI0037025568
MAAALAVQAGEEELGPVVDDVRLVEEPEGELFLFRMYLDDARGCSQSPPILQQAMTGALRCWDRTPQQVAALVRLRTTTLHGVQTTCAVAPNRMLAAMAAASTRRAQLIGEWRPTSGRLGPHALHFLRTDP